VRLLTDMLGGRVRANVRCGDNARFLNICTSEGIKVRKPKTEPDGTLTVMLSGTEYRRIAELADRYGGFSVKCIKERGFPRLWRILRKRRALIAGVVLFLVLTRVSALYVWEITVEGNCAVTDAEILDALERCGVEVGIPGASVVPERISNSVLSELTELCWMTVNVQGSRARVIVQEADIKPEMTDIYTPSMVCADTSGIITSMTVLEGAPAVSEGDEVQAGDVLVTGVMDSMSSGKRLVHASAEVFAETERVLSASMPNKTFVKSYTGASARRCALIAAGKSINLCFNSRIPYAYCDKITKRESVEFFGTVFPLGIVCRTYEEYTPTAIPLAAETAEKLLSERLYGQLETLIGERGEVLGADFGFRETDGSYEAVLTARCIEMISVSREMTETEKAEINITEEDKENGG